MDNPSVFENSTQKYSIWKRLFIYLIDGITTLGLAVGLFFSLGNITIPAIAKNEITSLNNMFEQICVEQDVPYKKSSYGLYRIDGDKYIEILIESEGLSEKDATNKYIEKINELDDLLSQQEGYDKAFDKFYAIYVINLIGCMCISSLIFQLIIPLTNKRHKTLGMLACNANLVDRDNIVASNLKVALRFLIIQLVELILVYMLFKWLGIVFEVLITLVLISFSRKRLALHDALLGLHIDEQERSYLE